MPTPSIRATTQEHLEIEDITQNLVILKDGGAAIILKIGAVNFNLLSEEEQDAIIYTYAALLFTHIPLWYRDWETDRKSVV